MSVAPNSPVHQQPPFQSQSGTFDANVSAANVIALEPLNSSGACGTGQVPLALYPEPATMPDGDARVEGFTMATLMLTRKCNMSCAHCSVESSPYVKSQPTEEELLQIVRDVARAGYIGLQITGGEPMLREATVMRLLAECRRLGLGASLVSNGFWGKSPEAARQKVKALCEAGVQRLTISYDRYHAAFQGPEPAVNIVRAAEEMRLPMQVSVNFTRAADDDLAEMVAPFEGLTKQEMRFYDVQPVGRARNLPGTLRGNLAGFCNAVCVPAITDDGRMTACNGPSYFSPTSSPLIIGSLREESIETLKQRHADDPILDTIRTYGPLRLAQELKQLPGFEDFTLRDDYSGMCDLCLDLTSQPAAMAALAQKLSHPAAVAERKAAQRVMMGERECQGEMNRHHINKLGAVRLFLRMTREPVGAWAGECERLVGRADFDWKVKMLELERAGAAIALQNALKERALLHWAPGFFVQRLQRQAITDTVFAMVHRQALQLIATAVRQTGGQAVLLGVSAMRALDAERFGNEGPRDEQGRLLTPARSTRKIELYVTPDKFDALRAQLLTQSFKQVSSDGKSSRSREVETLLYEGVTLELRHSLSARLHALPEAEMLGLTQPLESPELQGLATLSYEGLLLQSAVELTNRLFAHGLEAAWDFTWIVERQPNLDAALLLRWGNKCGLNRGFWITVTTMAHDLKVPLPKQLLSMAPRDAHQAKLAAFVQRHLYHPVPFTQRHHGLVNASTLAAFSDSWLPRTRIFKTFLREQRKQPPIRVRSTGLRHLRTAWQKWRMLGA